ncbi:MAG: FadR family transcriptional regulator [Acidobacteria bacterium]|nr:FadR family transcriptional regulator [Acidobacteriota bacterium]
MPRRAATRISDVIARRIRRQISRGTLSIGARLPAEREMARRYNTSRVSVREAYRSLEELGLLTIRRGAEGGAFVSEVDHGTVHRSLSMVLRLGRVSHQELTEARIMIEPPVARLAARRATSEDLTRLQMVVERQETRLARKGTYRPSNLAFHRTVAECAHNLPLSTLMNALADLTLEIVTKIDVPRPVQEGVCRFHRLIFDAIQRHDEEAAERLMLEHIGQIQGGIGESLARHLQVGGDGQEQPSADRRIC